MARILHVENEEEWCRFVRDSLADHRVESAVTIAAAIRLLDSTASYDLALIDLNLLSDHDAQGGQILDLLRARYPSTRRVVITGNPPGGALRKNIFDRYGVDEIIIKSSVDVPDLRRVVEELIALGPDGLSQSLKLERSSWRQRFRDWQRMQGNRIAAEVRAAQEHVADAGKVGTPTKQRAESALSEVRKREQEFKASCDELMHLFDQAVTGDALSIFADALDAAEEEFGGESPRRVI